MGLSTLQANCTIQAKTNQSYLPIQPHVELFQLCVYIPTFILGLLFNGMAMSFAFCKIRQLTESVIYVMSLMILDTLMLFVLPFKIISYHKKEWDLGNAFCSFLESLYFVNMYGSILISTCICVDRYIAILHPFAATTLRSPRKAIITCAIMSAGVWAGTAYTFKLHEHTGSNSCFHGFSRRTWETPILLIILEMAFLGCMIIMIFCTVQIVICLCKSQRLGDPLANKSKSINIIVVNLATFLLCFTPFHVALVLYYLVKNCFLNDDKEIVRTFLQISLCWANINCFLDAICYYFVFKEFLKLPTSEDKLRTTTTE
ncbi:G-protein coupled receptor 55-like [Tiliqua scincoides]|uniref:G-protein coupled receptor 55-like n=1 Tax=Tiliqua scincoides TaxID=71010 RepID=UPI003463079F